MAPLPQNLKPHAESAMNHLVCVSPLEYDLAVEAFLEDAEIQYVDVAPEDAPDDTVKAEWREGARVLGREVSVTMLGRSATRYYLDADVLLNI